MGKLLNRFRNDESGTSAIEYAIIASGIFLVIVTSVSSIGTKLSTTFSTIDTGIST